MAPANRRSLAEDVADRLRESIVRGEFGPGVRLSEASLAEAFGVSRGPIREAFIELERAGLLTIERHRGARVTELTRQDITEIYELRHALERLAMQLAVQYATAEDFASMDAVVESLAEAVAEGDVHRVVQLDIGFHDLVYRAARNARLYAAWSNLRAQTEFFLHSRAKDTVGYLKIAAGEHAELRDVIRSRSAPDALAMIEQHLRSAYDRLSQISS